MTVNNEYHKLVGKLKTTQTEIHIKINVIHFSLSVASFDNLV